MVHQPNAVFASELQCLVLDYQFSLTENDGVQSYLNTCWWKCEPMWAILQSARTAPQIFIHQSSSTNKHFSDTQVPLKFCIWFDRSWMVDVAQIWFKVQFFFSPALLGPAPPLLYGSLIYDMFVSYLRILGCLVATAEQFQVQMVFLLQEILQVILLEK